MKTLGAWRRTSRRYHGFLPKLGAILGAGVMASVWADMTVSGTLSTDTTWSEVVHVTGVPPHSPPCDSQVGVSASGMGGYVLAPTRS